MALATDIASLSKGKYKLGAVATDKKGKILSVATNVYKSHPRQAMYAKLAKEEKRINLHAEIFALIKAKESVHTIYVARCSTSNGKLVTRLAKPCPVCSMAIKLTGVKNVYWTS